MAPTGWDWQRRIEDDLAWTAEARPLERTWHPRLTWKMRVKQGLLCLPWVGRPLVDFLIRMKESLRAGR